MATHRQDIAKLGAVWNDAVLWYARAVGALWELPISDRRSWRYLGAIHGIDLEPNGWLGQGLIGAQDRLPPARERNAVWDQCQHAGWYFLPWHRGYLAAFEAIVASTIEDLNGPAEWKLPYWNYFDTTNPNARRFPQAFTEPTLPDGTSNPLAWWARSPTLTLNTALVGADITLEALSMTTFTAQPGAAGLGGSPTGFAQFGPSGGAGAMESDPHNIIHVMVGGFGGYMSDPNYAALDPLFWLHHCNVDRLWSAWLEESGNTQENGAAWANGPSPRRFSMPQPDGSLEVFTPQETLPGGALEPAYDDLVAGTPRASVRGPQGARRRESRMPARLSSQPVRKPRLLGSNKKAIKVGKGAAATQIRLSAPSPRARMADADADASPRRIFVFLENIKGSTPSASLTVSVGLPGRGARAQAQRELVKTVVLFGLAKASMDAGAGHAGDGLSVAVDATDAVAKLTGAAGALPSDLEVTIEQQRPLAGADVTVGKVSVVSQAAP
jgi:tyrosinase